MSDQNGIDGALVCGGAALSGAFFVVAPLPTIGAVAVAIWLLRHRLPSWVIVLAGLLSAVGAARCYARLERVQQARVRVVGALAPPRRCEVLVEVTASPVVVTPLGRVAAGRRARVDGLLHHGTCGADMQPIRDLPVRLYRARENLVRGERFRAMVDVGATRRFDNPGARHALVVEALRGFMATGVVLEDETGTSGTGIRAAVDRARRSVRRRIERTFAPGVVPHARALVLGEYDLNRQEQDAFRTSGLAHLLAVSGTHLVLAVLAIGALLRALLARVTVLARRGDVGRIAACVCIVLSWLYADFAGGGGSAYRAAAMLSAALSARALGRRPSASRALGMSMLGGALVEPLAGFDLSFTLSIAATAGIMAWGGVRRGVDSTAQRALDWVRTAAQATAAAHAACLPLLLTMSSEVPLLSVAANVLAAPIGELAALPVCLLHAVSWWLGPVEQGAATLGSGALEVVRSVAHAAADGGFLLHCPPASPWQVAVLGGGALLVWCAPRSSRRWRVAVVVALLALFELAAVRDGAPRGQLRVTVLDVGQGDAILVDLPDGRLMLVDGGGLVGSPIDTGQRVVLETLRHRRRRHIDVVVLSHPHPDHYGGLLTVLARIPVGELWVSGLGAASHPAGRLAKATTAAAARGTKIVDARRLCGGARHFGRARVDVLGPCPTFDSSLGANDNSLVVRIELGERVALLTGDAEAHQEARLLRAHSAAPDRNLLKADLLKVGHHGSRTSTGATFLTEVSPALAFISCGVRNRFGHPHAATLRTLERSGVGVERTDLRGALIWQTDGDKQQFRRNRSSWHPVDSESPKDRADSSRSTRARTRAHR